ncbi:hypothetical protein NW762_012727 [Fusarium torreyae]|uniref:Uncharacterized protein n=1 Tax=Fusarium torreyae TaxID=1237075 RepID=A0A9W8RPW0_9HYPO|nr:hypothetical protein NW762_012727 [Fusarium torreyae]
MEEARMLTAYPSNLDRLEGFVFGALKKLINLFNEGGCELANRPWVDSAILRYYTFVMLDLRHVCCCLVPKGKVLDPLPEEECRDIREEDSTRLDLLERLVNEFKNERGHYTDIMSFMQEYWVPKMRMVERDLASSILTEEQRREAEAIGVIWDTYGPHPPPCSNIEMETEQGGEIISELEKALRELDEIATDPARPFVG